MRKHFLGLALLALAIPMAATAGSRAGDGTLSVENGRGKVSVQARGGLIGRLDRGRITVYDLTPNDPHSPVVTGVDQPLLAVGENGIRYRGAGIRFRIIGGSFRVVIEGRGIDLSVVGRGAGSLEGETAEPGVYSLDGADCRKSPASCEPLPQPAIRFKLGGPERERDKSSASRD